MRVSKVIHAVDTHVCGEPGRVIVGGVLDVTKVQHFTIAVSEYRRSGGLDLWIARPKGSLRLWGRGAGAEIGAQDRWGRTPLIVHATMGREDAVAHLLVVLSHVGRASFPGRIPPSRSSTSKCAASITKVWMATGRRWFDDPVPSRFVS